MSNPDQPPPVAPPTNMPPPAADATTTVVDRLFPSQNGNALLSYYLGLFAIIPCAGLLLGPVSLVAGGRALKAVKETPGMTAKPTPS